jgi:hypothetical protein
MNVKIKNLVGNTESNKTELFNFLKDNYQLKPGMQQHIQLLFKACCTAANDNADFLEWIIPITIFVLQKHEADLNINFEVQKLAHIFFEKENRDRMMLEIYGNYIKLIDKYAFMDW